MNPQPFNLDQWVNHLSKEELTSELKKRGLTAVGNIAARRNRLMKNVDLPIIPNYDKEVNDELIEYANDDQLDDPNIDQFNEASN